jgi:Methyltransferase domain
MEARVPLDRELRDAHLKQSLERFPGPAYYQVLRWTHRILEPSNYLEIGVHKGVSLVQAREETRCIGVDPAPHIEHELPPQTEVFEVTSDDFFDQEDVEEVAGGPLEMSFIDGLHLFEQVVRDFVNVERHSAPTGLAILHDCLPLNEETATRERTTDFFSGDVWKATLALRRRRPDLDMVMVSTAPTGLCLVRGLDPANRQLADDLAGIEAEYKDLGFDYYLAHKDEMPPAIANDRDVVREWLTQG